MLAKDLKYSKNVWKRFRVNCFEESCWMFEKDTQIKEVQNLLRLICNKISSDFYKSSYKIENCSKKFRV